MDSALSENEVPRSLSMKRQRVKTLFERRSPLTTFERECAENGDKLYDFETIVKHQVVGHEVSQRLNKLGPRSLIAFVF